MKKLGFAFAILFLGGLSCFAQKVDPAQLAAAQKQNSAAMRKYVWTQRTELKLKGESKKVMLNEVHYDVEGKQQKTLLSEGPPQEQDSGGRRSGRLKAKVVEKKKGEFKEMLQGLVALVTSYTHIPPEKLKAAMAQAQITPGQGEMQGTVGAVLKNVVVNGDELSVWIDTSSLLFRRIEIRSLYDEKPVMATAAYSNVPSGESYMAKATLQYPEKGVAVQIDNYDYHPGQ